MRNEIISWPNAFYSSRIYRQILPPKSPAEPSCHIFPQDFPLQKGVSLEGAHTTRTSQLPGTHIFNFSSGQYAYGLHLGTFQAHTLRTLQLPGPHIILCFWQAGCRWEAFGRQAGCTQSATGCILTFSKFA